MRAPAGALVPGGSVTDSTADNRWQPVRVAARLAEPVLALAEQPGMLDGPVSFGAFLAAAEAGVDLPPAGQWAVDFTLPLATWTAPCTRQDPDPRLLAADGVSAWGWACSRAIYAPDLHTAAQIRRKPATAEMSRFTGEAKHHAGLGPHKARDAIVPAVAVREVAWFALAEPEPLRLLLGLVTHLGRNTRHGHGRVLSWAVERDEGAARGWRQRTFPDPAGRPGSIRAPYWHPSRRMPCR